MLTIKIIGRLDDRQRPLRRGRGIEIYKGFSVDFPAQDRKVLPDFFYLKRSAGIQSFFTAMGWASGMAASIMPDKRSAR